MIFSSNFLPCIDFFCFAVNKDTLDVNLAEQYQKQNYFNRAYILGPHKIENLTVPVLKPKNHAPIKDVLIDNNAEWIKPLWKTIENSYQTSIFFEYYDYLIIEILDKKHKYLIDLNESLLTLCLQLVNQNPTICQKDFEYFENKDAFIKFNSKKRHENQEILNQIQYSQNFGNKFEDNLSIIDLIFNKGPESVLYLKSKIKEKL